MANTNIFRSAAKRIAPANTRNEAGGTAYAMEPKQALAQYAMTGCLNGTYYADATEQLETVLRLSAGVEPAYIARLAIYTREQGFMKDMPALLVATLATRDLPLFEITAARVIDNGRMLRNLVQVLRSGVVGRKSLGTVPRRFVRNWLARQSDDAIFRASVGNQPSLGDVLRMVHPKPATPSRAALYGYLLGKDVEHEALPPLVLEYEKCKATLAARGPVMPEQPKGLLASFFHKENTPSSVAQVSLPDVPFQMLTNLPLGSDEWAAIATRGSWQMVRQSLNTFERHGVFTRQGMVGTIAEKLSDKAGIRKARVFPYQLMATALNVNAATPKPIREAIETAMEIAIENVPQIEGRVVVCPDHSGSMQSPVTGVREGATSKVRCIDVAALIAAAVLRKNSNATVLPFSDSVTNVSLNARHSVIANAKKLASLPSGGTNCSAPLAWLNQQKQSVDLIILVSDNESWIDRRPGARGTATMQEFIKLKQRNPEARLVCIDVQPNKSTQAYDRADVLNIGGFSDVVFQLLATYANGSMEPGHWVAKIEAIVL